jgi:hypothetical protein
MPVSAQGSTKERIRASPIHNLLGDDDIVGCLKMTAVFMLHPTAKRSWAKRVAARVATQRFSLLVVSLAEAALDGRFSPDRDSRDPLRVAPCPGRLSC